MARRVGIGAAIALVGVLLFVSMQRGISVDAMTIDRGEVSTYVEERARTRLPQTYLVTMPLPGRVLPIELRERDSVTAGQIVARMDPSDLESLAMEGEARVERLKRMIIENEDNRLENNAVLGFDEFLRSMELAVESAQLQTVSSEERFKYADREYHRKSALFENSVVTESDRNEAQLFQIESRVDYQKDLLMYRSLQAVLSAMKIGQQSIKDYIDKKSLNRDVMAQERREAESQLEKLTRDKNRVELRSPVDGVILDRRVSNERVLPAGEVLLEVGRLEELEVEADVLTQDAVDIRVGQTVEISGPAIGAEPVVGSVKRIYPQGFTKVSSLGVEQQRVLVVISFAPGELERLRNSGHELGVGYRIRVRVFTAQKSSALRVPRSAMFRNSAGQWQVFAIRGGRAKLANLELGLENDFEAEVLSGLDEGDQVIVAPPASLEDGDAVEVYLLQAAGAD